ncbi:MAG: glycine cleavage system protein GcvH [Bacteroidales bacterium]|jgi:glycine cleavage system H protein|nr:glycine cleavage system protein GcvH [Bacteroidales bacterium]
MNFPENLLYTNEHEWVRIEGHEAYVGITDYAQNELGEIVFVEVDTLGETLNQADVFGVIEAVKAVNSLFLPLSGQILDINPALEDQPELVNQDPYGEGWIIRTRIANEAEKASLLTAEAYRALIHVTE